MLDNLPLLAAVNIHKTYRKHAIEVPVLTGLDLEVHAGEFLSVVGSSGSGKSTLLHVLGTLDRPDKGRVVFNGERIDNLPSDQRDRLRNQTFGFIFQFYHLLPELSTLENVLMPKMIALPVRGWFRERRALKQQATELLDRVGLGHRLRHKPRELSGGEMQRAAIARALINRPQVLLADEPTGNLDADKGAEIIALLRDLNRQERLTIIMVTHNMEIVSTTDWMVRLAKGRVDEGERGSAMTKVWINGKLHERADAKISVFDHGLLYGDGVFEGIRIYNAKVFRLREHIDRLYESARHIALELPLGREQMTQAVLDTVKANAKQDGYIRLVVTRGSGSLGLDPNKCSDPQVIVIVDDISLYPVEFYEKGLEIITASIVRNHPNAVNPRIKSLNYLNNILAKIEAVRAGCQEAVMLNPDGEVAECTGDNIFLVKRGVLRTPHLAAGILEGVTRNAVIELAREAKIPVQEMALTRHDIYSADECFLTGTAAEVVAVVKCDGRPIGNGKPGPVTRQLRERFHQLARQS